MVLPAKLALLALPFSHLFLHWFSDLLFNTERSSKSSEPGPNPAKKHKNLQKKHPRNAPTAKTCKKVPLGGVKPLKLTTITTLSAVFPKAQSSQSRAKMEAKMKSSGTQNHEKSKTRAPQKTLKKKPTKSWTGSPFWCQTGPRIRGFLVPFSSPGPPWGQTGPRASPESPRDGPRPYF